MPVKLRKSLKALKNKVSITKKQCHTLVYSDKDESSQSNVTSGYAPKRELFDQINAILMYKRF